MTQAGQRTPPPSFRRAVNSGPGRGATPVSESVTPGLTIQALVRPSLDQGALPGGHTVLPTDRQPPVPETTATIIPKRQTED